MNRQVNKMTKEEFEELKSVGESVAVGERSPDEFYELLAVNAGELIEAYESFTDIKERDIHQSWHSADKEKLIDCLKFIASIRDALDTRNKELVEENKQLKEELARIQRLPHMDKAKASAVIMQVAAQLAKMPEHKKAKQLQEAVDLWATYTARVEADRDKLKEELEVAKSKIAHRDMKAKLLENKL